MSHQPSMCHGRPEYTWTGNSASTNSKKQQQPDSRSGYRASCQSGNQNNHRNNSCDRLTNEDETQDQQEAEDSGKDEEPNSSNGSNSVTKSSTRHHCRKPLAEPHPATVNNNKSKTEALLVGTPGPATYDVPSCFMSPTQPMNASAYVLASNYGTTIKGRTTPPGAGPVSGGCSPGPMAYAPVIEAASCKPRATRAVFGSARRAQQAKLYMGSAELNKAAMLPTPGPGPGTYRVGCGRSPGRAAPGPSTAPRAAFAPPHSAPHTVTRPLQALSLESLDEVTPAQHRCILGFHSSFSTPRRTANTGAHPATSEATELEASKTWGSGTNSSVEASSNSTGQGMTSTSGGRNTYPADGTGETSTHRTASAWSFGPPTLAQGLQRRRSKEGNVFISKQHAQIDPGEVAAASIPGPAYYVDGKLQLLSTHKSDGTAGFGSEKKAAAFTAKLYISAQHVRSDPGLTASPGPGTASSTLPGCIAAPLHGNVVGPRFGSPNRSQTAKAPFISKQHQAAGVGHDSPGPACYDATAAALGSSVLGDHRSTHFGTGKREAGSKVKRTFAPGPGAYQGDLSKLSNHAAPPAYSLGASRSGSALLGPSEAHAAPGVGSYTIALADGQCLPRTGAPSLKGRLEHGGVLVTTCSPGPAAYSPRGAGMGEEASTRQQRRWGIQRSGDNDIRQLAGSPSRQAKAATDPAAASQPQQRLADEDDQQQRRQPGARLSGQLHQQFLKTSSSHIRPQPKGLGNTQDSGSGRSRTSSTDPTALNSRNLSPAADVTLQCKDEHDAAAVGLGQDEDAGSTSCSARLPSKVHSPRKGFSMYGRCTCPDSVVSPGPAAYAVNAWPVVPYAGSCKFNGRTSPERLYISKLHAGSQVGADSPGPAAYSTAGISSLKTLSNHKHGGAFSFGSGSRPGMAKIKF